MRTAFIVVLAGAALAAQADVIAEWDLLGTPGDQASTTGTAAAHVSAIDLTRGAGLGVSAAGNSFSSVGWNNEAGDYMSFGFNVEAGYSVDLASLYIGTRSSGTGPGMLGLYYSGDGFSSALTTFTQSGTAFLNSIVNLSSLTGLMGSVEFRIYQIGTVSAGGGVTGTSGTFRLTAYFENGQFSRNLGFEGTVSPAPAALSLLGLGGLVASRRRRA